MLKESGREHITDKIIDGEIKDTDFRNKLFTRIGAKKDRFINVNFSHTYFDHCYFRGCVFENCNFNGCKFTNSNLSGSTFISCDFTYSSFQNTLVDQEILNSCPGYPNLKLKFARNLRKNFQGIGDADLANKAIKIELNAKRTHLLKSWYSNESYYRGKYEKKDRVIAFFKWLWFKIQDFIWGNGESTTKLLRTGFIFWIIMMFIDVSKNGDYNQISNYWNTFVKMPQIFLSIEKPDSYPDSYLSFIFIIRVIAFGLFMSILLKRYNKR
ncbi:pentapeptide repeat-containing protein [Tenacibaculum maritimum]|uniref:pentapeptide repeat-containing protein n=1 Tax=Tenacibaculum maritimum TaxID=107401 RepID=UPI001E475EDF|nr:pentapeptide repeat-containing protein [Tenacibaculum maritimum]MCD9580855.1 pentapeptide repeat-containing protein [Tenacibaculum maritimum]MCD9635129.1 pentapeptide repeat-containing protein [Tenacibaculum maritimum]